jgi:hypothetical protein
MHAPHTAEGGNMNSPSYERFAGLCAILAGIGGPLYFIAFVVLVVLGVAPGLGLPLSSLLLMLGGIVSTVVIVALYDRLRETDATFALWALLLGVTGMMGSAIHAGYDLANVIHPPANPLPTDIPSQIDPRGLTTFGIPGIAFFVLAWLMTRNGGFPRRLGQLGYAVAILYIVLYLGRLIILTPTNPVVAVAALLSGVVFSPAFFIWLGLLLRRGR